MRSNLTRCLAALSLAGFVGAATVASAPASACGDKHATPAKSVPADAAKVVIAVEGMNCGDCANGIRNALVAVAGVYEAEVSFEKGHALISYDAKATSIEALAKAIDKAGYKAGKASKPNA